MRGDDGNDWSDSEQQPAPKPRGRPRKSVPQQAAATSEEPVKGVLGKGPGGQRRVLDQDSKQLSEQEYHASKRLKGAADDESSLAGQDADNEQEHLPAKRKRTPLFSMQDIIAAEKSNGAEGYSDVNHSQQQQQQQQQGGLPPTGAVGRPSSRQQQHPGQQYDQDWSYLHQQQQQQLFQQQQQQQGSYTASPAAAAAMAAAGSGASAPAMSAAAPGPSPAAAAAAAAGGHPALQQQSPMLPLMHPAAAAAAAAGGQPASAGSSRGIYGTAYGPVDPAAAAAAAAATVMPTMDDIQQQFQQQQQRYPSGPYPHPQQQQRFPPPAEFNPDMLPKGPQRDMALQRERRMLAEAAQCELGPDSLGPDTNVATLVQRILKCGVLTRKTVEYRKRAKGLVPSDYNRGSITSAGLIRCSCHGQDITMSEFEQHSNSQIHRPAEYIFIKSIDMSLKGFANLVLQKPIESSLWYCLACNEGGDLLCCDGCPAAYHTTCLANQPAPQPNQEWVCADCVMAGKKPRWSATGPLRRQVPLAGAAGAACGSTAGSSSMRRGSGSSTAAGRSAARGSSSDVVARKGSGGYSGLYGAGTAAAAVAGGGSYGQHISQHSGTSHPASTIPMTNPYYESEQPHMSAAAGMTNAYGSMANPQPPGGYNIWPNRSQGLAPTGGPPEPQQYPGTGGFSHSGGAPGNNSSYGQGIGFTGPAGFSHPMSQGSAGYGDHSQGFVASHIGAGGFGASGPRGGPVKPEMDSFGLGFSAGQQQQQQQGSNLDQLVQQLVGGNPTLLQMLQKHVSPSSSAGLEQLQQQQLQSESRHAGAQTPPIHVGNGSGSDQQQHQQQLGPQSQQQQQRQQQRQTVVARKGSSTLDPVAAAAAAPAAQLPHPTRPGAPQQQQHLAALAAAAAEAAETVHTQQKQQQEPPASEAFAAAGAGGAAAASAQLFATALKPSTSATAGDDIMAQVMQLAKQLEQQQQQPAAAAADNETAVAALLQMITAAAPGGQPGQQQQQQSAATNAAAATAAADQPAAAQQVSPAAEATTAAAAEAAAVDDTATTGSGVGEGQPVAAAADATDAPQPMEQDDASPAAAAAISKPASEPAATSQQQQQQTPEERRAAIAAALQAGSELVSNVLGAQTLSEAQRAVAAGGAQLLSSLGGLL